jgi:hypothetical protein
MRRRVRAGHGRGGVGAVIFPSIGPTSGDNVIAILAAVVERNSSHRGQVLDVAIVTA